MISHLLGQKTRGMTWVLSPSGRKGRHLGRENQDKGWAERGRWRTGSWDVRLTVEDSERTRLQTYIDSSWRDASLQARQLRKVAISPKKVPKKIQHGWIIWKMADIIWQGMRKESNGTTYWWIRLAVVKFVAMSNSEENKRRPTFEFSDEWFIDLIFSWLLINGSIVKSQKARTD